MNYEQIKAAIRAVIKTNTDQDITGDILQQVLVSIVDAMGAGYQFMGVATPETNPGTPDAKVVYLAAAKAQTAFPNFGQIAISDGLFVLAYASEWTAQKVLAYSAIEDGNAVHYINSGKDAVTIGTRVVGSTIGAGSLAVGTGNEASGANSFAQGQGAVASAARASAEGYNTLAMGSGAHAEGSGSEANTNSHAEGYQCKASGSQSHAEGRRTTASGNGAHAEGYNSGDAGAANIASGQGAHAEGYDTNATANGSHAEGVYSTASGQGAHAEGSATIAAGEASHTEGADTQANAKGAHAEGQKGVAAGINAHAEGYQTVANGHTCHAEGWKNIAGATPVDGLPAPNNSTADGNYAHAEGNGTWAKGNSSHAEGKGTITNNMGEHAEGQFNKSNRKTTGTPDEQQAGSTQSSIGIGTANDRKNAFEVMQNGDAYLHGVGGYNGTNPAANKVESLQAVLSRFNYDIGGLSPDIGVYTLDRHTALFIRDKCLSIKSHYGDELPRNDGLICGIRERDWAMLRNPLRSMVAEIDPNADAMDAMINAIFGWFSTMEFGTVMDSYSIAIVFTIYGTDAIGFAKL